MARAPHYAVWPFLMRGNGRECGGDPAAPGGPGPVLARPRGRRPRARASAPATAETRPQPREPPGALCVLREAALRPLVPPRPPHSSARPGRGLRVGVSEVREGPPHARPTAGPSAAPLLKRGVSQSGLSPRAVPLRSCRPWAPGRLLRGSPRGWPPTASPRPEPRPEPAPRWPLAPSVQLQHLH